MPSGINVQISRRGDGGERIKKALRALQSKAAYVGVPAEDAVRNDTKNTVNNAQLLFLHTNGSPAKNIPARPVLEPAIKADGNREPIMDEMKSAAQSVLAGDDQAFDSGLKRVAMTAQNVARAWFTDSRNGWAPNAPSTVARKGSDQPLIDTGELRKAIIGIVRED